MPFCGKTVVFRPYVVRLNPEQFNQLADVPVSHVYFAAFPLHHRFTGYSQFFSKLLLSEIMHFAQLFDVVANTHYDLLT